MQKLDQMKEIKLIMNSICKRAAKGFTYLSHFKTIRLSKTQHDIGHNIAAFTFWKDRENAENDITRNTVVLTISNLWNCKNEDCYIPTTSNSRLSPAVRKLGMQLGKWRMYITSLWTNDKWLINTVVNSMSWVEARCKFKSLRDHQQTW